MSRIIRSGLMGLANEFAVAKSKGLGLDESQQIADAAVAGRIVTLLIEADREIAHGVSWLKLAEPDGDALV